MALTKAYAKIAAGLISDDAENLIRAMKRNLVMGMSPAAKELQDLGFIKEVGGIWQFTRDGIKVAAEV